MFMLHRQALPEGVSQAVSQAVSQGQGALPAIETEALAEQQIRHYLYQQHHMMQIYRCILGSSVCQWLFGARLTERRTCREWLTCVSDECA
jgi:hypothetical protein